MNDPTAHQAISDATAQFVACERGVAPATDEVRGLHTPPVVRIEDTDVRNSAEFQALTTGFGARSEYGLQPFGAFIQLGAYVL